MIAFAIVFAVFVAGYLIDHTLNGIRNELKEISAMLSELVNRDELRALAGAAAKEPNEQNPKV